METKTHVYCPRTAHFVRLALGVVMAVGVGAVAYLAEGGGLLTYLLPLVILLLTLAISWRT
jgi:hypothetical protein